MGARGLSVERCGGRGESYAHARTGRVGTAQFKLHGDFCKAAIAGVSAKVEDLVSASIYKTSC
jgi:hypothetical protein